MKSVFKPENVPLERIKMWPLKRKHIYYKYQVYQIFQYFVWKRKSKLLCTYCWHQYERMPGHFKDSPGRSSTILSVIMTPSRRGCHWATKWRCRLFVHTWTSQSCNSHPLKTLSVPAQVQSQSKVPNLQNYAQSSLEVYMLRPLCRVCIRHGVARYPKMHCTSSSSNGRKYIL